MHSSNRRPAAMLLSTHLARTAIFAACAAIAPLATAAIPDSERAVLLDLYDNAGGASWTESGGWAGAPGTECTWFGIACDGAGDHVVAVELGFNHLAGTLPPSLQPLTNLNAFDVGGNALTGSIPSLSGLADLQYFAAYENALSGTIPSLEGIDSLAYFYVDSNQLVGPPPLPTPPNLQPASSTLCPNYLEHVNSDAWDLATGESPWYQFCAQMPDGGVFAPTGSMAHPRRDGIAVVLADGRVLVAGGYDGTATVAESEIYDPATGTFSASGVLNAGNGRSDAFAAVLSDGKVLVGGGVDSQGFILSTAEVFDPATGTFTFTTPMNAGRTGALAAKLVDGRVLVVGGYGPLASAEIFDPSTAAFTPTGSLDTARSYDTVTALDDGRVLVAAGADYSNDFYSSTELFDPSAGAFSYTGSLAYGVAPADFGTISAAKLADGRVLIPGGNTLAGYVSTAQLYDPATSSFTDAGTMSTPRNAVMAVTLNNGEVLVAGGYFSNTADVYDPWPNRFNATGAMQDIRAQGMAVALRDGRALLIGGWNTSPASVLASAEIYTPDLVFRGNFD